MRTIFLFLLAASVVTTSGGTFHAQWIFRDGNSNVIALRQVITQPIAPYGVDGTSLITGDRRVHQSAADGSLIASNLFNGRSYRVQVFGPNFTTVFTNSFDTNVTGLVNGADPAYLTVPVRDQSTIAFSQAYSLAAFLRTNISGIVRPGANVTFTTNGTGPSQYITIASSGGGGGSDLWDTGDGAIYPSGEEGSETGWESAGGAIYPD